MPRKTKPRDRKAEPAPRGMNAYEVLGLTPKASQSEIRRAYRRLALAHHPDRQPEGERAKATERFKTLNDAYQKISSEEKRSRYDSLGEEADNRGARPTPDASAFIRDRLQFVRSQAASFAWDTRLPLPQWVHDGLQKVLNDEHGKLEQIELVSLLPQAPDGLTPPHTFKGGYVIATGLHLVFAVLASRLESRGSQLREVPMSYFTAIPWPALSALSIEEPPRETYYAWVRLLGSRNVCFPIGLVPLGRLLTLAKAWNLPIEAPRTKAIAADQFVQRYFAAINAAAMASFLTALSFFVGAGCGSTLIWTLALPVCAFFLSRGSVRGRRLYETQILDRVLSGQQPA